MNAAKVIGTMIGALSSYYTIKNELEKGKKESEEAKEKSEALKRENDFKAKIDDLINDAKRLRNSNSSSNKSILELTTYFKSEINARKQLSLERNAAQCKLEELEKRIASLQEKKNPDNNALIELHDTTQLRDNTKHVFKHLDAKETTQTTDLNAKVENVEKDLSNIPDELSDSPSVDLDKKMFINIDYFKELFEGLNGYGKLALLTLFMDSIIFSALISIIFTLFGNHLIKKYQIENKFPALAKLINIRLKFQNFYIKLNLITIILVLLIQVILSLAILQLYM